MAEYKVEHRERMVGPDKVLSIAVSSGEQSYEEYVHGGLVARLATSGNKTTGVLYRLKFGDNKVGYQSFKTLAERVSNLTGDPIQTDYKTFAGYMTESFSSALPSDGINLRIKLKDELPQALEQYIHDKANTGGYITDFVCTLAIFGLIRNPESWLIYTAMGAVLEAITALSLGGKVVPTHAPGYWISRDINYRGLMKPTHVIRQFERKYEKLAELVKKPGNSRQIRIMEEELNQLFGTLSQLFESTQQKGISVHLTGKSEEVTHETLNYLISGQESQSISEMMRRSSTPKP